LSWEVSGKNYGKFITLEGGEGTGKTTQIRLLAGVLKAAGLDSVLTREPGGAPGAELIRSLLVKGPISRWQPMTEALLHFSSRLEHVNATIIPALKAGRWVISDRFSDSTVAYQGYGHSLGQKDMLALHRLVLGDLQPDLTVILDVPCDVGLARALKREDSEVVAEDRYERMGWDFHRRVKDGFLDIARRNPERCAIIDANRAPEEVSRSLLNLIEERLGTTLT
jgi:dTMP kinase